MFRLNDYKSTRNHSCHKRPPITAQCARFLPPFRLGSFRDPDKTRPYLICTLERGRRALSIGAHFVGVLVHIAQAIWSCFDHICSAIWRFFKRARFFKCFGNYGFMYRYMKPGMAVSVIIGDTLQRNSKFWLGYLRRNSGEYVHRNFDHGDAGIPVRRRICGKWWSGAHK